jgi:hypothetical protein
MARIVRAMGNMWSTPKVRPVHGTYLEDRPRRRPVHTRMSTLIPKIETAPRPPTEGIALPIPTKKQPPPFKEKALRIFHEVALRREAFNRGTLIQTRE